MIEAGHTIDGVVCSADGNYSVRMPDGATAAETRAAEMALPIIVAAAKRQEKIDEIKSRAARDIAAIAPEHKQRNMMARMIELQHKVIGGQNLTSSEQAEIVAMQAAWSQIKSIRERSNAEESEVV